MDFTETSFPQPAPIHCPVASQILAAVGDRNWSCAHTGGAWVPAAGSAIPGPEDARGLRLCWVAQGAVELQLAQGKGLLAEAGALVVLAAGETHQLRPVATRGRSWVLWTDWPTSAWCAAQLAPPGGALLAAVTPCAPTDAVRSALQDAGTGPRAALSATLLDAAARDLVTQAFAALEVQAAAPLPAALADRRVGRWLAAQLHARGPLPALDQAAQACHLSRAALARRMQTLLGTGCVEWLARWRLTVALHRLSVGGDVVADLVADCGYESEAALRKAFKRANGITPGSARRTRDIHAALAGAEPATADTELVPQAVPRAPRGPRRPPITEVSVHDRPPGLDALISRIITNL